MTRVMYAQLVSQRFYPTKPFHLPPVSAPSYKAAELGMKLACGFEILYGDKYLQSRAAGEGKLNVGDYDFELEPAWKGFRERLTKLQYFRNELPGSKLYKSYERAAKEEFLKSKASSSDPNLPNPYEAIKSILSSLPADDDPISNEPEDNDDWMTIDPAQLDHLMGGGMELNSEEMAEMEAEVAVEDEEEWDDSDMSDLDEGERAEMKNLSKIVGGVSSFMQTESGIDGALFPHEREPEEDEEDDRNPSEAAPLQFDMDRFMQTMMSTLGINDMALETMRKEKSEGNPTKPDPSPPPAADPLSSNPEKGKKPPHVSFAPSRESDSDSDSDVEGGLEEYMEAMDDELAPTKIGADFEKVARSDRLRFTENKAAEEEEEERHAPVDLDVNLVKNLLESFASQQGLPGPASSLLGSMGLRLPRRGPEEEEGEKGGSGSGKKG
ncbi:SGT1 protein-domain-containing protein [Blyttiomyces helicus]|uniref:SGT1 protein-domain-containing protein n=1 Tax=Blyttiomyces helicus TaxID=388810 RepID=A0A4P9W7U1_9FUNG|nr:SGT1 protein-domain-containing protein [Blyttiomyces helicus]|eukprot:RKO86840.1 SGT1 protein-domain-containing protein [Blyttiomyces helicus]